MELVTIVLASIVAIVVAHIAAYFVIRTLYPPAPAPAAAPAAAAPAAAVFTQPSITEQQNVTLPTYEAPLPTEASREEREPERRGPPPAESTSIRGDSRVDVSNTQ